MNIFRRFQFHRRSILFALAVFAVVGGVLSRFIPVSLFPQVTFPRISISIDAGDRPAERMAVEVTRVIEEAARSVPGVKNIRSNTSRGSAEVSVNFKWGLDMTLAMLQIESAINQSISNLPPGTTFEVRRMDPTVFPVLGYSITSEVTSPVKMRDIALYEIRPALSTVQGVAKVAVQGGKTAEYRVIVDPQQLASYNLSLADVADKLSATNVLTAVGRLEENYKLYLALANTQLDSLDDIRDIIIYNDNSGAVRLSDIAIVKKDVAPQWTRVTADGRDAVLFQIYQQPDGNTVQIARDIKAKLEEIAKILPADLKVHNWYDQSELIISSAKSAREALLIGIVLAALILVIFLQNIKITMIAALTVPAVLGLTVLVLSQLKMSFNIMTLGGMAAAVGLIIDDVIVMIEHIMRRSRENAGKNDRRQVIRRAAREFTKPLAGSSASTIIIFAPLAFLGGISGAFFKALSITIAASLGISFIISWIAVPILSLQILRQKDSSGKDGGKLTAIFHHAYEKTLGFALAFPVLLLPLIAVYFWGGYYAYQNTGSGFMPSMDEGGFILDYRAAPGTSVLETDRLLRQLERILKSTPEVRTYSRRTGFSLGGTLTESNEGDFFVRLKPLPRRSLDEVMDDIRHKIEREVPGLEFEMPKLMEDLIGDLTAVPQPIEIKLYSDDEKLLRKVAPTVAEEIKKIPGVVEIQDGIVYAGDALNIEVDRTKAAIEGMTPEEVSSSVESYLSGIVASKIQRGPKMIGIRIWVAKNKIGHIFAIKKLRLRAGNGHLVPLQRIASLKVVTGQPQITRDNLKRMVAVTARISGRDMGSTINEVKKTLKKNGLIPKEIYYLLGGMYKQQQIAFRGLIAVFVGAAVLLFALLLYLYESWRMTISIMLTTLTAGAAVFIGLWFTGADLNIISMMGMTMIIGIVTEVAIFYNSEFFELPDEMPLRERLITAGKNRMRPIAMTTFAAILALFPLAFGLGQGSEMLKPLAIAIISGLAVQMPLVLILLPVLISAGRENSKPLSR